MERGPQSSTRLVLDTHVVLDWLVFNDPRVASLSGAILRREARALTDAHAIDELKRVLAYPRFELSPASQDDVLARYVATTVCIDARLSADDNWSLPPGFPQCRDPDDQFLLAIAFHGAAQFLITRDRRLLKVRKRAAKFGFELCTPEAWR